MTIKLTMPIWCPPLPPELPIQVEFTTAINLIHVEINSLMTKFVRDREGHFKSAPVIDIESSYLRCIESQLNRMFG